MWFSSSPKEEKASPSPLLTEQIIFDKLKSFILKKSKLLKENDVQWDTPLFSSGVMDSLATVQFIGFIEKEFKVKLSQASPETLKNLDTLKQVSTYLLQK